MSVLVLRLSGSLQSWSGYRHMVSMATSTPTEVLPRKSAVNGLIGAAIGPFDRGFGSARDLESIGERYTLHVRVEAQNPVAEDFQVLSPLVGNAKRSADRSHRISQLATQSLPSVRGGGTSSGSVVGRRDYLSHSEFFALIESDPGVIRAWMAALREPTFIPYLGRRSCPPSFPFLFGYSDTTVVDLLSELPHVEKHQKRAMSTEGRAALEAFTVTGNYSQHRHDTHPTPYNPAVTDRNGQLAWAKEHLIK